MNPKPYSSKSSINCGPCSFINLIGLKGNKKVENQLAKTKLHPFKATNYSTFLVWANKYRTSILVYTTSKKLNKKIFDLMFYYEKIPKSKQNIYKKKVELLLQKRNKKYKDKIKLLKDPIKKLNELLKSGHKVAFLISDYYLKRKRSHVPHWIVAHKKLKDKYYFMDSAKESGKTILTKSQLQKGIKLNKETGFYPQLIAYKKK